MTEDNYLIKKIPPSDAPILNALLKSRVFMGKALKEKIMCSYIDGDGEVRKATWAFKTEKKLNYDAFEYYIRCLKVVNNKGSRKLSLSSKEFRELAGISLKRYENNWKDIDCLLKDMMRVQAAYKLECGKTNTFYLMYQFNINEELDEINISFSEYFIAASKELYIKHFDIDMYDLLRSPTSKVMMFFLESRSLTDKVAAVKIRRDELVSKIGLKRTGDQQHRQEAIAIKKSLSDLLKRNFITKYDYKNTGIHRENPLYTIFVNYKEARTEKRDQEHKNKVAAAKKDKSENKPKNTRKKIDENSSWDGLFDLPATDKNKKYLKKFEKVDL